MGRPSKSVAVTKQEGKSHRTKAEMKNRKEAELAALTGLPLRESTEVRDNPVAHEEFLRVCGLLAAVGKNDALYEAVINDYCTFKADIARYVLMRESIQEDLDGLADADMDQEVRYTLKSKMYKQIMDCDKQIQAAQKKRFDIEKENAMTISSAMRSIPKAPAEKKNPLLELMDDG